MTVHRCSRPADVRAHLAARLAAVAGLLLLAGLALVRARSPIGFPLVLACVAGIYVQLNRNLELRELAEAADLVVADIARRLPVLRTDSSPGELLLQVAPLNPQDHALVHDGERWLVVTKGVLVDTVLSATERVDVTHLGRRAPVLDPFTPVDHLSRPPYDGEVWLIGDGDPPLGVERQDLLGASAAHRTEVLV